MACAPETSATRDHAVPASSKLQPRWCGLTAEQVAANQHARMLDAMLELAGETGYQRVTVKRVCELAGVSRRTFYDRFPLSAGRDVKQRCLLAAYDHAVARARHRVRDASRAERDPRLRVQRGLHALLVEVQTRPRVAQVVLHEVYAAGLPALAHTERARRSFRPLLAAGAAHSPLIADAVIGAIEHAAARHRDTPGSARSAVELASWVSLGLAAPAPSDSQGAGPAPRLSASAWLAGSDRHTQLVRAGALVAAGHGYAGLSSARIAAVLGFPEDALPSLDREKCFLGILELLAVEALTAFRGAAAGGGDWADGVQLGVAALLRHLAARPLLVRLAAVEAYRLGPRAFERIALLLSRLAQLHRRGAPLLCAPSELAAEASVAALWRLVSVYITHGLTRRLPSLGEPAGYLLLAPALGPEATTELIARGRVL
jgi:AcrR family transcriptional regulator